MKFIGSTHVKFINEEMLKIFKILNVIKINFGIETASNRLLKIIRKGITKEETQATLDLCYENGITTGSAFLIGLPEETEEDLRETYEFTLDNMKRNRLFTTGTNLLTPLPDPNSAYWDMAIDKYNIDIHNFEWKRLDFKSFHTYYLQHNGGTIKDWWEWRKARKALYIGGLPEDKFLKVIESYEMELIKYNEANSKIDRIRK